jgi:ABC-type phosphate/phosphonate transport system substrate-binding protein
MKIRNPKSEIRNSNGRPAAGTPFFGLRLSGFLRISAFGFRISRRALVLVAALLLAGRSRAAEPTTGTFRLGVSYASFGTVSHNDASAALKVWAATVAKERNLTVDVRVQVFELERELREALAQETVDAASMSAEEFSQSGERPAEIFLTAKDQGYGQRYVLVVHRGAGIGDLPALKGSKLVRHVSPTTSPALAWLETALARHALARAEKLFGEVTPLENPSKCVLRVFFRQSDACLVTTNAFALACELNPQLSKDLQVLAVSPLLIPALFFIRPNYAATVRQELERSILELHTTTAGQQVLTVFQGTRMERQPLACFETTRQLLEEYERLRKPTGPTAPAAPIHGSKAS